MVAGLYTRVWKLKAWLSSLEIMSCHAYCFHTQTCNLLCCAMSLLSAGASFDEATLLDPSVETILRLSNHYQEQLTQVCFISLWGIFNVQTSNFSDCTLAIRGYEGLCPAKGIFVACRFNLIVQNLLFWLILCVCVLCFKALYKL